METVLKTVLNDVGYSHLTVVNGETAALYEFAFSTALISGLTAEGYRDRWCYLSYEEAVEALHAWDGEGHPAGSWITALVGGKHYVLDGQGQPTKAPV
jgi:hypothetical protein